MRLLQAISRTAKHRLERGIWTSPGGGDIRWGLFVRVCVGRRLANGGKPGMRLVLGFFAAVCVCVCLWVCVRVCEVARRPGVQAA